MISLAPMLMPAAIDELQPFQALIVQLSYLFELGRC